MIRGRRWVWRVTFRGLIKVRLLFDEGGDGRHTLLLQALYFGQGNAPLFSKALISLDLTALAELPKVMLRDSQLRGCLSDAQGGFSRFHVGPHFDSSTIRKQNVDETFETRRERLLFRRLFAEDSSIRSSGKKRSFRTSSFASAPSRVNVSSSQNRMTSNFLRTALANIALYLALSTQLPQWSSCLYDPATSKPCALQKSRISASWLAVSGPLSRVETAT